MNFAKFAPLSEGEIIDEEIRERTGSKEWETIRAGEKYMRGENDILAKERKAIGEFGELEPVKNIADNRIAHAFLRELVEQKCSYILGRRWAYRAENEDDYAKIDSLFDDEFRNTIYSAASDAIALGVAWVHVYYDCGGKLSFRKMKTLEMIPIYKSGSNKELEAMIRSYCRIEYKGRTKEIVECAEYWDASEMRQYEKSSGQYRLKWKRPHARKVSSMENSAFSWGEIPFVALRYNDDEVPLIAWVKGLIDEYDNVVSSQANALEDQPNSILVLRNYDGQKLDEFRRNLATYRAVKVSDDGGVESIGVKVEHEAVSAHLDRLRRDIYAFGRGVDNRAEKGIATKSGVALKHEYASLDMDSGALERQISMTLRNLVSFGEIAFGSKIGNIDFIFDRDIIINELEAIEMFEKSYGRISKETVLFNHPWVSDVDAERASIESETSEERGDGMWNNLELLE